MEPKKKINENRQIAMIVALLTVLAIVCAALATVFSSSAAHRARKDPATDAPAAETRIPAETKPKKKPSSPAVVPETDPPRLPASETEPDEPLPVSVQPTWNLPVEGGTVSKGFDAKVLVFSQTMGDYRIHTGVDFSCPLGADVLAAADGEIGQVYTDPFEGVCVRLLHENGYVTVYKNLAPALAPGMTEGNHVAGGQVIGSVGETSAIEIAEEAHLHFEVLQDGVKIDPMSVLPYEQSVISYTE